MVPRKELKEGMSKFVQSSACVCYLLWPTSCPIELRWSMAAEESEDIFAGNQAAALLVVNARRA